MLSNARSCTPQVFTSSGRLTALSALQSGERVLSMSAAGVASYQEVFMWGHRDAGALASFVTIRAGGATLRATPGERPRAVPKLLPMPKHWRPVSGLARLPSVEVPSVLSLSCGLVPS